MFHKNDKKRIGKKWQKNNKNINTRINNTFSQIRLLQTDSNGGESFEINYKKKNKMIEKKQRGKGRKLIGE